MSEPEPLPGLEDVSGRGGVSPLEQAVRRTLSALEKQGHLGELDAGKTALAIELAQVITVKRKSGRTSTLSNDARLLTELLDSFTGEASDVDDDLAKAMREWGEVVHGERPHASPEVLDGT